MTKKLLKSKTKRQTCRQKYKIQKKVREHNRKIKKGASKKSVSQRKKKDPGIPNSLPFKQEILMQAVQQKANAAQEKRMLIQQKKLAKLQKNKKPTLESMAKDAEKRGKQFESGETGKNTDASSPVSDMSARAFYKDFCKVVHASDVVLQVIDARDPNGTRCVQVEEAVLSQPNKRLVLVLNKIDLVPKEIATLWIAHLRKFFPTIAFKCSTQDQKEKRGQTRTPIQYLDDKATKSAKALGVSDLLKLLNNYCRNNGVKTTISVGVVGLPNTGKSSLINSLKRSRACFTGSVPGLTRCLQEVQLDKHIRLIDSPGVVMSSSHLTDAQLILKNCSRIENVQDPVPAVSLILARCQREKLMVHYNIPQYSSTEEFLCHLARRLGRLKKGGIADSVGAGRKVLMDWVDGEISYYTLPPQDSSEDHYKTGDHLSLVTEWSKEFCLEELDPASSVVGLERSLDQVEDNVIQSDGPVNINATASTDEDMESIDEEEVSVADSDEEEVSEESSMEEDVVVEPLSSKQSQKTLSAKAIESKPLQSAQSQRQAFKKLKKKRKRADKVATALGSEFEEKMETVLSGFLDDDADDINDAEYDFNKYFPPQAKS